MPAYGLSLIWLERPTAIQQRPMHFMLTAIMALAGSVAAIMAITISKSAFKASSEPTTLMQNAFCSLLPVR